MLNDELFDTFTADLAKLLNLFIKHNRKTFIRCKVLIQQNILFIFVLDIYLIEIIKKIQKTALSI